jgi:hypothetical protein
MVFWGVVGGALVTVLALAYWYDQRTAARRERLGQPPVGEVRVDPYSAKPEAYGNAGGNGAGG